MSRPAAASEPRLSRRAELTAYTTAFFSIGIPPMAHVIGPLWAIEIGASPFLIGIAMGARSFFPFLFSIHGGALIDRFGVRRVMCFCAAAGTLLMIAYPAMPTIAALVVLQLFTGFLYTVGWIGAQTQISQLTGGAPKYMGRFASITAFANFVTPPLVGAVWDAGGAWAAFGLISAFSLLLFLSAASMPVAHTPIIAKGIPHLRELVPSITDYGAALRLVVVPAVGFVVACSFLMNALFSIRFSFLPVYMKSVGFEGTIIGFMIGGAFLVSSLTSLLTPAARRVMPPQWVVLSMIVLAATGIGTVPLFRDIAGLGLTTCLFGAGVGLGMAFIMSLLSRAVETGKLGLSIGLRTTANRFSSFIIPIVAGAIIDFAGIAAGFYAIAGLILTGVACAALFLLRTPAMAKAFSED